MRANPSLTLLTLTKERRVWPEEVVHARNVIAFFVWALTSGFCD